MQQQGGEALEGAERHERVGLAERELQAASILLGGRQAVDMGSRLFQDPDGLRCERARRRPCRRAASGRGGLWRLRPVRA